jgi:ESS family glutamate:Na+ symporter
LAILTASALLLVGFVLRATVRPIQLLFVPASVVGGLVGLVALQAAAAPEAWHDGAEALAGTLRSWPGPLLAVVFAGLLLERPDRPLTGAVRSVAAQGVLVWIIVLGEVLVGLIVTWLFIMPVHDVPPSFGQLIEAGFAGGHGTATALGTIFTDVLDFPAGMDLGLFMATFGLVFSVVSGIVLVNIGVRRGWTARPATDFRLDDGLERPRDPRPVAWERVRPEVIDPLAFQVLIVAAAIGAGAGLQHAFIAIARLAHVGDAIRYLENVPLFLFTLIGGLLVRKVMAGLRVDHLIDTESIKRIVAIAMEFLIVAAVASLRLEAIAQYFWPLALLVVVGVTWALFCLLVLARRLLPASYWFELGLLDYGMATGTTAQGMLLLRIIDKDLETNAAQDYALAAPLSAPFIGGGVITLWLLPLALEKAGMPIVIVVMGGVIAVLYFVGRAISARIRGPRTK